MNPHGSPVRPMDARSLETGDVFFHGALIANPRRVVRSRQVAIGVTEVLHGFPHWSGGLNYTLFSYGATVLVPTAFSG